MRQAKAITDAFDRDPAQEESGDGWPADSEAYGWAAHRRDRTLWEAFRPVREHADVLLATATAQLALLPAASRTEWEPRIGALSSAAEALDAEHDIVLERLRTALIPSDATVDAVDAVLTEFFDEAWPALDAWAAGADAVIGLDSAVRVQRGSAQRRAANLAAVRGPAGGVAAPHRPRRGGGR
ncbi:hypothetical protein ACWF94_00535 [Streptomyces sp. NPDC055078]